MRLITFSSKREKLSGSHESDFTPRPSLRILFKSRVALYLAKRYPSDGKSMEVRRPKSLLLRLANRRTACLAFICNGLGKPDMTQSSICIWANADWRYTTLAISSPFMISISSSERLCN